MLTMKHTQTHESISTRMTWKKWKAVFHQHFTPDRSFQNEVGSSVTLSLESQKSIWSQSEVSLKAMFYQHFTPDRFFQKEVGSSVTLRFSLYFFLIFALSATPTTPAHTHQLGRCKSSIGQGRRVLRRM